MLFLFTAFMKFIDLDLFEVQILAYPFNISLSFAAIIKYAIPFLEIILAILLIYKITYRLSLFIIGCICLSFAIIHITIILRGLNVICGCYGRLSGYITWWNVVENVVITSLAWFVWYITGTKKNR